MNKIGLSNDILDEQWIAFACDGAAVMLGRKSGVSKLIRDKFPKVVVWHCANHRLELSVHDVINSITPVNNFKTFCDKLYALYHASSKNARELAACAVSIDVQMRRIGRVLGTRWVASSYRTVKAIWDGYPALAKHLKQASNDPRRDSREKKKYNSLFKTLVSECFVLDLGLMHDALQELSELSMELQSRKCNIHSACNKIESQIILFSSRIENPGSSYKYAKVAIASE